MKSFPFPIEDTKPGYICMVIICRNDVFEVLRVEFQMERCDIDWENTFICILQKKGGFLSLYTDTQRICKYVVAVILVLDVFFV